jgi:hypothetical protein
MIDNDSFHAPRLVWNVKVYPKFLLTFYTFITTGGYCLFLLYCLQHVPPHGEEMDYPSVSAMIAFSRGTTLTFSLLVYCHTYAISNYLVLISEYLNVTSYQFYAVSLFCIIYNVALIVVTYLPLTGYETAHNTFSMIAFFAALFSVFLHRHAFWVWPSLTIEKCTNTEFFLILTEFVFIAIICVTGFMFWFHDITWAEYIFIGLILIDKEVKIDILRWTKLIRTNNSYVQYSFYSPKNPIDRQSKYDNI